MSAESGPLPQRRFPWKIYSRLALIQAFIILFGLAASGIAAHFFFKQQFTDQVELQLKDTLTALGHLLPAEPPHSWCVELSAGTDLRLTAIAPDGQVICDSHHSSESMDNHLARPEVQSAIGLGAGASVRHSATLDRNMLYEAVSLPDGRILRGAIPLASVEATLFVFDTSVGVFLVGLALLLVLYAIYSGRELISPMTRLLRSIGRIPEISGESSEELGHSSYGEWSEIEEWVDQVRKDLAQRIETLILERQEHSTLMSAISDAILAVDRDGAPLFFNSRFEVLFRGNAMNANARLYELFRQPEILEAFRQTFAEGRPSTVQAIQMEHAGRIHYFSLSVAPLLKNKDDIYGAIGVFHDITELKTAEQMRIDFVANVSHELRTPLTVIKGFADTVAMDVKAGHAVDPNFLEAITRNSDRLMALIHDLLDLSSLESTEFVQKSRIDTHEISERVISQLAGAFEKKRQKVVLKTEAPSVLADPRRLEQVLVNLLDNASKYSPAGSLIEVAWTGPGDDATSLRVKNPGPGIPPEHHARLFERFYRVDKGRSRELGGTGLGLAIVKHIMQRHGGGVRVESAPGAGATFICQFPGV
jgi:two-component system phosphate regulon sensor histidine kinase PhoR